MFCKSCGQHISDGDRVCSICGAQQSSVNSTPSITSYAQIYQTQNQQTPFMYRPMPMKFYKFLIYFDLFFRAIWLFYQAYSHLSTGLSNIDLRLERGREFADISLLYKAAVVAGVCEFMLAIYCLVVRRELANYKAKAPQKLSALFLLGIAFTVAYNAVVVYEYRNIEDAVSFLIFMTVLSCIWELVLLFCCNSYFEKRAYLFDNWG